MDYVVWAKALLLSFKYLPRIVEKLDKSVMKMSLASEGDSLTPPQYQAEAILNVIERKRRLINLNVITQGMLKELPEGFRTLLTERYIKGMSCEVLAAMHDTSLRNLFRVVNNGLKKCADYLRELKLDNDYFERNYGQEAWLKAGVKRSDSLENEMREAIASEFSQNAVYPV